MRPEISEFSYGYALTDELVHWHGTALTAAPVFPSLYEEGQASGGFDVRLDRPGLPLFLQFKLSHCLRRMTAKEARDGLLTPPYYRMHLRPARTSRQHEMLLGLDQAGEEVYYVSPAFHEPWELNDAYASHDVKNRSRWFRPSSIGPLPDDGHHSVAFQHPGSAFFCSEPMVIEGPTEYGGFLRVIEDAFRRKGRFALSAKYLRDLAIRIEGIARRPLGHKRSGADIPERVRDLSSLQRIAYYSNLYLGAGLFVVQEKPE